MDISKYVNTSAIVYNITKTGDGTIRKTGQTMIKCRINYESIKYIGRDGEVKYAIGTIRTSYNISTNMYVSSNNNTYRIVSAMPIYDLDGNKINHYRGVLTNVDD